MSYTHTRTLEDLAGSDTIDSRDLIARLREVPPTPTGAGVRPTIRERAR